MKSLLALALTCASAIASDPEGPPRVPRCKYAIPLARAYISQSAAAPFVHLENPDVADGGKTCHVMFRRRALVAPAVVTVDVDKQTGALRFPGDE